MPLLKPLQMKFQKNSLFAPNILFDCKSIKSRDTINKIKAVKTVDDSTTQEFALR